VRPLSFSLSLSRFQVLSGDTINDSHLLIDLGRQAVTSSPLTSSDRGPLNALFSPRYLHRNPNNPPRPSIPISPRRPSSTRSPLSYPPPLPNLLSDPRCLPPSLLPHLTSMTTLPLPSRREGTPTRDDGHPFSSTPPLDAIPSSSTSTCPRRPRRLLAQARLRLPHQQYQQNQRQQQQQQRRASTMGSGTTISVRARGRRVSGV
jgi:hypothetical protein